MARTMCRRGSLPAHPLESRPPRAFRSVQFAQVVRGFFVVAPVAARTSTGVQSYKQLEVPDIGDSGY